MLILRSWWHHHTSLKLFWLQPMAPWTASSIKTSYKNPDLSEMTLGIKLQEEMNNNTGATTAEASVIKVENTT